MRQAPPAIGQADVDPLEMGDVYAWATEQAALVRQGRFEAVGVGNVAEEIADVGRTGARAAVRTR